MVHLPHRKIINNQTTVYLQPSDVEAELEHGKDGHVVVQYVVSAFRDVLRRKIKQQTTKGVNYRL